MLPKQFFLFALRNLGWAPGFSLPSYEARLTLIDLDSLADRRLAANCFFAASTLLGSISASHPRQKFVFNSPVRVTRSSSIRQLQHLPPPRSSYFANSPIRTQKIPVRSNIRIGCPEKILIKTWSYFLLFLAYFQYFATKWCTNVLFPSFTIIFDSKLETLKLF